jgi:hypothetical protein
MNEPYPEANNKLRALSDEGHNALSWAIHRGELPPANTLTCQERGNQARDYHHHKGYQPEFWLDVIPLCAKCHRRVEQEQAPKCQGVTMFKRKCNRAALLGADYCHMHLDQAPRP